MSEFDSTDRDVEFLGYQTAYIQHPERHALANLLDYVRNREAVGCLCFYVNNGLSLAGYHSHNPGPPLLGATQPFSDEAPHRIGSQTGPAFNLQSGGPCDRLNHLIVNNGLTGDSRLKNDTGFVLTHIRCHFRRFRRFVGF